ncbi:MAG TPA: helix-turn-helix transcriptional regulator [Trebonia sp.]|nr:helix-turn-helix transcriptional regulator [Trebonia sp.]
MSEADEARARVLEASDPDVASEIFRQQYTRMRMRMPSRGGQPLFRVVSTQVGRARLDNTTFWMALEGSADPFETITIIHVRRGTVCYSVGGSETVYGPGDTGFPLTPGREWSTSLQYGDAELLVLDPVLLDQTAATEPGAKLPVQLLSNRPHSELAAAQLWRAADFVRTSIAQPDAGSHRLVTDSAARVLAASVLAAFPNSALTDPTIEDRHDAHPAALRRALAFIDEHAEEDIGIADVAAAAFVTIRAVQMAFRRHLDTTPLEYLRRVRLDRAHRDLLAADPARETVTAIAYRWGFSSASRFGGYYRQAYGISPSHTLRHD